MNISPISFGRAVKINASKDIAQNIAHMANANSYVDYSGIDNSIAMHSFVKEIFYDVTPEGKAKVYMLSPNDVYIYSGKESEQATKISQETNYKIKENKRFVNELANIQTKRAQTEQYGIINARLLKAAKDKIQNMAENGIGGRPKSTIDVEANHIKSDFFGEYDIITRMEYNSKKGDKQEKLYFDINY